MHNKLINSKHAQDRVKGTKGLYTWPQRSPWLQKIMRPQEFIVYIASRVYMATKIHMVSEVM